MTKFREKPLRGAARMQAVLGLAPAEREAELAAWLREDVEQTLASPQHLPPIPHGARAHAERVAERLRNPDREPEPDREAARQHGAWMAELSRVLVVEGLSTAHELVLANEPELLARMIARLDAQARALDALDLPWWPQVAVLNQRPVGFAEHVARGVRWLRDAHAAGLDRFARRPHPALALAQAEARDFGTRLLGAGLDSVLTKLREPPARPVEPGSTAFHGEDPTLDQGADEIAAPGADLTKSMNLDSQDEWEAP